MEVEVVGLCKEIRDNDLIIVDDEGEEINMDSGFFKDVSNDYLTQFIGKRISFYYKNPRNSTDNLFKIDIISDEEKQTCLCHNYSQGNYMMTQRRVLEKLN